MKKKIKLSLLVIVSLVVLTACGTSEIAANSDGLWDKFVYFFAEMIQILSFNERTGIGIILFTLVIRTILLPVYNMQMKSSQKMQEIQPKLKELQKQYPGKDTDSRMLLAEATQQLYKDNNVNPYSSLLPLFIQMPLLLALYQALSRVAFLKTGTFLWLEIANPDPYFVLPVLAAIFTFLSTWLSNKGIREKNGVLTAMMYIMPIMILVIGINMASGVALYWTISNAYQVFQTLIFNNPFKKIAEYERMEREEKEKQAKIRRAKKKAQKKRK
ncbi:YidC/Oxa1 family membrane protein insertase [Streptococcus zalophi]|uniref:Membrane protein insertase YidC n=1 Tax=Streptococcus zalophi TaxID=640031 RepID=A0A934UDL6_9STRE|nr:YidC/Oxa1 family membrane protein insertase [Streptococcus zalophi]MBJ8349803.1 membrane protein insertase YidC [Streptococcus zalophi]MCR8967572.1 YidC/Oxa1 family membrane protein insertase [Streptococcus zalophi]